MNIPTTTGTLPATVDAAVIAGVLAAAETMNTPGDIPILRICQSDGLAPGEWIYGQDDEEVSVDTLWAINPYTFMRGYIAWSDDFKLLGEEMASTNETPITLADMGPEPAGTQGGWKEQVGFQLVCRHGPDLNTAVLYKNSSFGARKAFKAIARALAAQQATGSNTLVPLVELTNEIYVKGKKTYYNPIFKIVDWLGTDSLSMEVTAPEKVKTPAGSVFKDIEVVAEEVEEIIEKPAPEEAPRRRRRR